MRRRLVTGGVAVPITVGALVGAMAVLAPTGASASATHHSDRSAPSKGVATKPAPGGTAAAAASADRLVQTKPSVLKAGKHDAFKAGKVLSSMGLHYVPYERTYRGIPVVGGDFVVATDANGKILTTSVAQTRQVRLRSTHPTVSKAAARATSRHRVSHAQLGRTRLVVLQQKGSRLAWETTVTGRKHGEPSRQTVYVDAHTGRFLTAKEHVIDGTGNSAYDGNPVTIPTTRLGLVLLDDRHAHAGHLKCQNATGNATFTGTDDNWGNGTATDRETGCVDAIYVADQERQMLSAWLRPQRHATAPAAGWPIRVGLNDVNAYYDGTQVQIGHNTPEPVDPGSSTCVGHEFGHGVDDNTPGGISGGGTQEFVADTFGAATEWYANNAVDTPTSPSARRSTWSAPARSATCTTRRWPVTPTATPPASRPARCTRPPARATTGSTCWPRAPARPTGSPPARPATAPRSRGLGIQKAQQIMYNAMLLKTTSSSYLKYRTWTLTAAKNLFPGSCTEFNTVKAAWDAVTVPAQSADPTCSASGGVTVTNPGDKTGTVGTAISSFTLTASPLWVLHLVGDRAASRHQHRLLDGHRLGHADHGRHVQRDGERHGCERFRRDDVHLHHLRRRWRRLLVAGPEAGQPRLRVGHAHRGPAPPASIGDWSSYGQPAHAGTRKAWLDGYGTTHTDTLNQSVTIPAGCAATLTFWVHVDSAETTTSVQYDKLTVKAGSTTLATYSNLNKAAGYSQKSFNVSSFAGQTVTISFTGTEDSSLQTSFVIDDTALTVS